MHARQPGVALALPPAARGAALASLAIFLLAVADGGFFPPAWRLGGLTFGAAAVLLAIWTPAPRLTRTTGLLLATLAALALWSLASAAWSVDQSASLLDAQRTLLYLVAAASFVLAGEGLTLGVLVGTTAVAAWSLGDQYLGGMKSDPFEGTLLTGTLGYANALGALAAIGVVLSVGLALEAAGRRRILLAAPLVVLAPALALTNSRGSWAAACVGLAVVVAVRNQHTKLAVAVVLGSLALLATLLVAPPRAAADRAVYWQVARDTFAAHPAAGTGSGSFASVYAAARGGAPPVVHDAHSLYLQTAAELGLVGLVLVLVLVALPLVAGLRAGAAVPLGGFLVFALHTGIDWDWQMPAVTVAGLALAAALVAHVRPSGEHA